MNEVRGTKGRMQHKDWVAELLELHASRWMVLGHFAAVFFFRADARVWLVLGFALSPFASLAGFDSLLPRRR